MSLDFPKPAIIIPATKELLKPSRELIVPSKSGPLLALLPGMYPFGTARGTRSVVNTDNIILGADLATYTTSIARSIGTASNDRIVVVGVGGRGASDDNQVDSVELTDLGIFLLRVANLTSLDLDGANSVCVELWAAEVPTGTSSIVEIIFNNTMSRAAAGFWAITGGANVTPDDTGSGEHADPCTATVTVHPGGVVVAYGYNGSDAASCTVSGGVTEEFDRVVETGTNLSVGASGEVPAGGTLTPSFNWAAPSVNNNALIVGAW